MKHIEENIKSIAKERGYTMTDVINAVGMSQAGFYRMFDKETVKLATLQKIASFLDTSIESLIDILAPKQRELLAEIVKETSYRNSFLEIAARGGYESIQNILRNKDSYKSVDDVITLIEEVKQKLSLTFEQINKIQDISKYDDSAIRQFNDIIVEAIKEDGVITENTLLKIIQAIPTH